MGKVQLKQQGAVLAQCPYAGFVNRITSHSPCGQSLVSIEVIVLPGKLGGRMLLGLDVAVVELAQTVNKTERKHGKRRLSAL